MLAEPGEIERLAVDQEPNSVHLDRADADALVVAVHDGISAYQLNLKIIEIAVAGSPRVYARNAQRAAGSGVGGDLGSRSVPQNHLCLDIISGRGRLDPVIDHTSVAVEIGNDGQI